MCVLLGKAGVCIMMPVSTLIKAHQHVLTHKKTPPTAQTGKVSPLPPLTYQHVTRNEWYELNGVVINSQRRISPRGPAGKEEFLYLSLDNISPV